MSRSLSFSKRTVAIALAASVVASGAQVVAPTFETPFGAAVAQAQQAGHVTNEDVVAVVLVDDNGDVTGDVRAKGAHTANSGLPALGSNAKLKIKIDIANAAAGDTVEIIPTTEYVDPMDGNEKSSRGVGIELSTSQDGVPLKLADGTVIATLNSKAVGTAKITFNDAVENYASGTLDVEAPVQFGHRYGWDVGPGKTPEPEPLDAKWKVGIKTTGSGDALKDLAERNIVTTYVGQSTYITRKDVHSGSYGSEIDGDKVNVNRLHQRLLSKKNSRVVISPTPSSEISRHSENNYGEWKFTEEVEPKLRLWEFDENDIYVRDITDPAEIEKLGITYKVTKGATDGDDQFYKDGSIYIDVYGVEGKPYKPVITLEGRNPYVGVGPYDEGRELGLNAEIVRIDDQGNVVDDPENDTYTNRFRVLPGTISGGAEGEAKVRTADVDGVIKNDPAAGKTTPARIAGKDTTFTFTVKNTGNVPMTKVTITPEGGEPIEKEVSIAPGATGEVDIDYAVPADAEKVTFTVESDFFTIEGNPITFLVDQGLKFKDNGDGTVTLIDPEDNEVIVVTKEEYDKLADRVKKLEDKQDIHLVAGERNEDNSITLTLNNGQKITIPAARKAGLEKCLNAPGGTLLALLPVLGIAAAGLSQINVEAINKTITDWQKGAGIYNEQAARFVAQNRGALGALLGSLVASLVLFVPGLCGDVSLAGALKEAFGEGSSKKAQPETKPEEQPEENAGE